MPKRLHRNSWNRFIRCPFNTKTTESRAWDSSFCRAKEWFCRSWLIREFPARWGSLADAIIYAKKRDAQRVTARIGTGAKVQDAAKHRAGP
jgi:hypothetical protein